MSLITLSQNPATLGERLHDALAMTPALIADVIHDTCRRFSAQRQAGKTERIEQLIEMGAWTDAALALVELELPQWRIRRLVYDSGEWHCALSRERELPDWLDDSVEGRHADLALAILSAFVEVKHNVPPSNPPSAPAARRKDSPLYEPLFADNFA
jgi:hypothetical protein